MGGVTSKVLWENTDSHQLVTGETFILNDSVDNYDYFLIEKIRNGYSTVLATRLSGQYNVFSNVNGTVCVLALTASGNTANVDSVDVPSTEQFNRIIGFKLTSEGGAVV